MKKTDFSRIADHYDYNPFRVEELEKDNALTAYIQQHEKDRYEVLDLSCGTGLYLAKQIPLFDKDKIRWTGLDASLEMLEKAKAKLDSISLVHGYVEDMPFNTAGFDYIVNNYSFHHYQAKEDALDEIIRVLMTEGIFRMHNIAIHAMPKWWVYHYFPEAFEEDKQRFWHHEDLHEALRQRGCEVQLKIDYRREEVAVAEYLPYAENRDISVLTLISDQQYEIGLMNMRKDVEKSLDTTIPHDFAELFITAKKL